jgi:hypothetical protein
LIDALDSLLQRNHLLSLKIEILYQTPLFLLL